MTLILIDLPTELLRKILIFAGDSTKTLLQCERVCRLLQEVVQCDQTWKHVVYQREYQGVTTHRFCACITQALRNIRNEQKNSESNIIIQELGIEGWKALIHQSLQILAHFERLDLHENRFLLRNDTSGILAELVQDAMYRMFDRASVLSCAIAQHTGQYPIVTPEIYQHVLVGFLEYRAVPKVYPTAQGLNMNYHELMNDYMRDSLVRRLSHRASVVKMTNPVYNLAWETMMRTTMLLLLPACHECIHQNERGNGKKILGVTESIFSTPPLSKMPFCEDCQEVHQHVHTPVPRQIEDAARDMGLCNKVHGHLWLADTYEEAEAMEEEAMEEYEFAEESDDEAFTWVNEFDDSIIGMQLNEDEDDDVDEEMTEETD